jgi:hypothetical protein
VPEDLRQKRNQYDKIQGELQNLLNFIKEGNFSKVVSEALTDAENRGERLKGEIQSLEYQRTNAFKAPPKEWIEHRLEKFYETLNKNPKAVALALKDLLGSIEMEPVVGECHVENGEIIESRSYYVAHTTIQTLALLDEEAKGLNWLRCRRRWDSNPRYGFSVYTLSKRAPSATRTLLQTESVISLNALRVIAQFKNSFSCKYS